MVCECVELPAGGRVGVRAGVRGAAERGGRPPRPPRRPRALPRGQDEAVRARARAHRDAGRSGRAIPSTSATCDCGASTTARTRARRHWPPTRWACRATPSASALGSFAGVPHRLEEVTEREGVLYVNDSKATNVASAVRGIEAFDGGVHAILGGSLKGGGFEGLRDALARAGEGGVPDRRGRGPPCRRPRGHGAAGAVRRRSSGRSRRRLRRGGARRRRPPLAGVRELRCLPRLRGPRRRASAPWSTGSE